MASSHQIKILAQTYKASLSEPLRPKISDYLSRIEPDHQDELLRELVPIDVKFRKRNGEFPSVEDYCDLGPIAISIASSLLETSDTRSNTHENNVPTVTNLQPDNFSQLDDASGDFLFNAAVDTPPMQIGPYHLIEKIGSGGMGTVWLAKQEEPVRRRVALKLISRDIDDEGMIARFEA